MSYGIDHQNLTIGFNPFSWTRATFWHQLSSHTYSEKKTVLPQRNKCHIWCAALLAQVHLDQRELDNFQPKFSNISNIQPSVLSPVKAEGRKAANRGSRLRTVIWIKEFLLVLHLRTHWQTWKKIDEALKDGRWQKRTNVYYLCAFKHSTDIWLQSPSKERTIKTASKGSKSLAPRQAMTKP